MSGNYCDTHLPPPIVTQLEAAAFRSLRQHLQERSDEVQNMELMALSGFCRNCLAKWMVLEARRLVDSNSVPNDENTIAALNALGYEEAAQHVYGMDIKSWKDRYQKKATDEMMERFNQSKPLQAKHDKKLLETRGAAPPPTQSPAPNKTSQTSNVCCQDVEEVARQSSSLAPQPVAQSKPARDAREVPPYTPPALPELSAPCRISIITVSDRAFRGEYATGDLSGPAVREAIQATLPSAGYFVVQEPIEIVPDDMDQIKDTIFKQASNGVDIILTTGGTGMSPRDVTPEATQAVVDVECPSLLAFCTTECSRLQPLASLSRGTAGILGKCMVANLPGNPKGVHEVIPVLLPLLLHAVVDMRRS